MHRSGPLVSKGLLRLPGGLAPELRVGIAHYVSPIILRVGKNPSISALTLQKTDNFSINISVYIVLIAWLYVTVMMALAEATSSTGSILGALITFTFYGLMPAALVAYLMGAPARRRAIRQREAGSGEASAAVDPDAGGHAPAATQGEVVAPMRKEP